MSNSNADDCPDPDFSDEVKLVNHVLSCKAEYFDETDSNSEELRMENWAKCLVSCTDGSVCTATRPNLGSFESCELTFSSLLDSLEDSDSTLKCESGSECTETSFGNLTSTLCTTVNGLPSEGDNADEIACPSPSSSCSSAEISLGSDSCLPLYVFGIFGGIIVLSILSCCAVQYYRSTTKHRRTRSISMSSSGRKSQAGHGRLVQPYSGGGYDDGSGYRHPTNYSASSYSINGSNSSLSGPPAGGGRMHGSGAPGRMHGSGRSGRMHGSGAQRGPPPPMHAPPGQHPPLGPNSGPGAPAPPPPPPPGGRLNGSGTSNGGGYHAPPPPPPGGRLHGSGAPQQYHQQYPQQYPQQFPQQHQPPPPPGQLQQGQGQPAGSPPPPPPPGQLQQSQQHQQQPNPSPPAASASASASAAAPSSGDSDDGGGGGGGLLDEIRKGKSLKKVEGEEGASGGNGNSNSGSGSGAAGGGGSMMDQIKQAKLKKTGDGGDPEKKKPASGSGGGGGGGGGGEGGSMMDQIMSAKLKKTKKPDEEGKKKKKPAGGGGMMGELQKRMKSVRHDEDEDDEDKDDGDDKDKEDSDS